MYWKNKFYILTHTSLYGYDIETSNLLFQSTWLFPKDIRNLKMQEDNHENIWAGNVNLYRYIYQKACWETVYENLFITAMAKMIRGIYMSHQVRKESYTIVQIMKRSNIL